MRKAVGFALLCLAVSVPLRGAEPAGVKLKWQSLVDNRAAPTGTDAAFLFPWGGTQTDLAEKLTGKKESTISDAGKPTCWPTPTENEDGCTLGVDVYDGWFADTGEHPFQVTLFFLGDKFYRYSVNFPELYYGDFKRDLTAAVGKPKSVVRSTVSNRMGARFSQEVAIWSTKNTLIEVEHRADTVDEGDLTITYRPIAVKSARKPRKTTKAPF